MGFHGRVIVLRLIFEEFWRNSNVVLLLSIPRFVLWFYTFFPLSLHDVLNAGRIDSVPLPPQPIPNKFLEGLVDKYASA